MHHLFQVGAGSGGMPVLDAVARDPRIERVTLVEPDIYKPHNVVRHLFAADRVGQLKGHIARDWLRERRPELKVDLLLCDLLDPDWAERIGDAVREATVGICAADSEKAKYHFDGLMRKHGTPWTLGEVLSGGIGGFVHWFRPGGPCYGCVASHLKRAVEVDKPPVPDYSLPGGPIHEVTVPASKSSIAAIAGLHAHVTLGLLGDPERFDPGFTSLLFALEKVPDVFAEAYRPFRFKVPRSEACLFCRSEAPIPGDLDQALEDALGRLSHG